MESVGIRPADEGAPMALTTAILYAILIIITLFGGVGVITALIAMSKSSYRD